MLPGVDTEVHRTFRSHPTCRTAFVSKLKFDDLCTLIRVRFRFRFRVRVRVRVRARVRVRDGVRVRG